MTSFISHTTIDHRGTYGPGSGWGVLADPEGNEFCILRSEAEVRAQEG